MAPTHTLGEEIAARFGSDAIQIQGRERMVSSGLLDCHHHDDIMRNQMRGLGTHRQYCDAKEGCCTKRSVCEYLAQFEAAQSKQVVVLTHDHLRLSSAIWAELVSGRDLLVIDECFLGKYRKEHVIGQRHLAALDRAASGINGLDSFRVECLRPLRLLLEGRAAGDVVLPAEDLPRGRHLQLIDRYFASNKTSASNVVRVLMQAAQQQAHFRRKLDYEHEGKVLPEALVVNLHAYLPSEFPILILDSTTPVRAYEWALGADYEVTSIDPAAGRRLAKNAKVVQCLSGGYPNSTLISPIGDASASGQRIINFIKDKTAGLDSYGIISTKQFEGILLKRFPPEKIMHYNMLRGLNRFQDVEQLYIVGYQGVSYSEIARQSRIIFNQDWDDEEKAQELAEQQELAPIQHWSGGMQSHVRTLCPENRYINAYYQMSVVGEVEQALGRARLYLPSTGVERTVYLLCKLPLTVEVDEIINLTEDDELSETMSKLLDAAISLLASKGEFSREDIQAVSGLGQTTIAELMGELRARLDLTEATGASNRKVYRYRVPPAGGAVSPIASEAICKASSDDSNNQMMSELIA